MRGNVTLFKKDSSIFAQNIDIDHNSKIAYISNAVTLKRKDGFLNTLRMQYKSDEEKLIAENQVELEIQEGAFKTAVKCDQASFFTDYQKDMGLKGNIEVSQGKKLAIGEEGIYSQKNKTLDLGGNVKAVFEKAQIILKKESAENLKNPEAKTILEEKTIVTSEKLVLSTVTGDAGASGSVHVFQKGKEARGDLAEYNEKKETLTLTGNVSMKKDADWVKCKKVVVSVKDETFEAFGQVEAEFRL
jgi:lipopolysaccharide assembly outer membrane protein LptD (OstA)